MLSYFKRTRSNLFNRAVLRTIIPSAISQYEKVLIAKLGNVVDPLSKKSLSALGSIHAIHWNKPHDKTNLTVDLDLFIPGHPDSQTVSIHMI